MPKIKITRTVWVSGRLISTGTVIDATDSEARQLKSAGQAVDASDVIEAPAPLATAPEPFREPVSASGAAPREEAPRGRKAKRQGLPSSVLT